MKWPWRIIFALLVMALLAGWLLYRGAALRPPVSNVYEIHASDSGRNYIYPITSRFMIVLDQTKYPPVNFTISCSPPDILGRISNIPAVAPPYYAARFVGAAVGLCTIKNNDFRITVRIAGPD